MFGDYSDHHMFIYKVELTCANNLVDPVGYTHYPGESEAGWFMASSVFGGYPISGENLIWTPGLNLSYYVHDVRLPESHSFSMATNQSFEWSDTVFLVLNVGLDFRTYYYKTDFITSKKLLWGMEFQVRI